jgi:hypothetical protein
MRALLPLCVVALTACGSQQEPAADPPVRDGLEPTVSVVGDTAFLELPLGRSADNGEIQVTFDAVTEDSRCPSDVQCVWEGNGGIRLTLSSDQESGVFIVNSTLSPQRVAFAGFTIGFRDLRPHPVAQVPTDRDAYVATISVYDTGTRP